MVTGAEIGQFIKRKVAFDEPGAISPDYITERSTTGAICKAALTVITRRGRVKISA